MHLLHLAAETKKWRLKVVQPSNEDSRKLSTQSDARIVAKDSPRLPLGNGVSRGSSRIRFLGKEAPESDRGGSGPPTSAICGRDAKGKNMDRPNWLQKIYWSKFAKPVEERGLFSFLVNTPVQTVLEVGIGNGQRMKRIARLIQSQSGEPIRYVGTDEFESGDSTRPHIPLKQAHQIAGRLGFKSSLIPGTDESALPRVAHKFGQSDLILVNTPIEANGPLSTWIEHLAHDRTTLFYPQPDGKLKAINPLKDFQIRAAA